MILQTLAIIAVVWAVGLFSDPRWRSFVYTLPVPTTIVLLATGQPVRARHLIGVVLLVLFFRVAAALQDRAHLPLIPVVVGATTFYAAASLLVSMVGEPGYWPTLTIVVIAAIAVITAERNAPPGKVVAPNADSPIRLAVISASTILAATIGRLLGPFVVTFPYSGIPLLVDARTDFAALARGVTRNSPGFLAFITALYLTQGTWPAWLSFTLGWVGFIAAAATSNRLTTTNR